LGLGEEQLWGWGVGIGSNEGMGSGWRWKWMGRGLGEEGGRGKGLNDRLRLKMFGRSIDDHDHLERDVGTKARFGGYMGQTEAWDSTKGHH